MEDFILTIVHVCSGKNTSLNQANSGDRIVCRDGVFKVQNRHEACRTSDNLCRHGKSDLNDGRMKENVQGR